MMTVAQIDAFVPQVLGDAILEQVNEKMDFYNNKFLTVFENVDIKRGRTLELPIRGRLGQFQDKAEGQEKAYDDFTTDKFEINVSVKGLKTSYTMEADGGYNGDLEKEVELDMVASASSTMNSQVFNAILSLPATDDIDNSTKKINYEDLLDVFGLHTFSNPSSYTLLVSNRQLKTIKTMQDTAGNYILNQHKDTVRDGIVGDIDGVNIQVSDKILANEGIFDNYLVQEGSVAWVPAQSLKLNKDTDNDKDVYWFYASYANGVDLMPNKKVKRIKFAE